MAKITEKNSYVVDMYDILGETLYKELQPFRREQTLNATSVRGKLRFHDRC